MNSALETLRLRLRPFTLDDARAWHAIWGDPEVVWWGASESFESSRRSLERLLAKERTWPDGIGWLALIEKATDEIVGDVLLQPAPFVTGTEIGWHLRRDAWGRGLATEAARALVARTFADGVLDRIHAIVARQNRRSLRVVEKLGMRAVRDLEYADLPHRLFEMEAPA